MHTRRFWPQGHPQVRSSGASIFSPIPARRALRTALAAAGIACLGWYGSVLAEDPVSIPLLITGEPPLTTQVAPPAPTATPPSALVTIGLNFEMSRLFTDSNFIPPDTMGSVGPNHVVELINGRYEVYNKATGVVVDSRSLDGFWTNVAGLTIPPSGDPTNPNFTFDPRVVYDPVSGRWFASSIDADFGAGNNVYVARSDTDDPTGDWDGVRFAADTAGAAEFHDYPTLALDADGVYLCTQDFGGGGNESCYSIPKADLLLAAPSIANMTRFEATPAGLPVVTGSVQPPLNFEASDGRAPLLGANGGALVRSDILGAGGAGATLGVITAIAGDPGHATPPAARQPHPVDPTVTIENVAPRFVANVFEQGDSLWAVHAVAGTAGNSAVRWYQINEATNTVLQTGLIEDTATPQDFHEPSIVVNQFGNVVIGYTCSGPTVAPGSCVSVGQTVGGVTTFEPPWLVQAGAGHYYRDFASPPDAERNRWGDYSATVVDPVDGCTIWTFQEFVAVSAVGDVGPDPRGEGGNWGTQATELVFDACAEADLVISKLDLPDPVVAGSNITYTIAVVNFGPSRAFGVVVSDVLPPQVTFVSGTGTGWSCVHAAGTVTCDWQGGTPAGSLAAGEPASPLAIVATVNPATPTGAVIGNTATVSSATTDPVAGNNSAAATTNVIGLADLALTKTDDPDPVLVGNTLTYTLGVTNLGPGPATGVTVSDTLPATATFVSLAAPGWACATPPVGSSGLVSCTLGAPLAAGASASFAITVAPTVPTAPNTLANSATVSAVEVDPVAANNSATATTLVGQRCDTNFDGDIDRYDIFAIRSKLGPASGINDPFDANGDGSVTVFDARQCGYKCTIPGC